MRIGQRGDNKAALFADGMIDIHSHILPGVDDGARNMGQSMDMVRIAYEEGIRTIIATPHYMPEGRSAGKEQIEDAAECLREEIAAAGYDLELYIGNEIYFHEEVEELLEREELLTLAGSDCVLVEFSPMEDVRYLRNALGRILSLGLTPVVAHVERYLNIMKQAAEQVEALKEMGALIQVNAATVEGKYGKQAQKQALGLLKGQMVDFIGTDAHSDARRSPRIEGCLRILLKKCPEEYIKRLLYGNAERYLLAGDRGE